MKARLFAISGYAGAGKNTVADMITSPAWQIAFAEPIKDFVQELFDFSHAQIYGDQKNVPDRRYPRADGSYLTPREAMQRLGTEWGRTCYPDIWAVAGVRAAARLLRHPDVNHVVITDCRFINEAKLVKQAGGIIIRVVRPGVGPLNDHPSEMEQGSYVFATLVDYVIHNSSDLETLKKMVDHTLKLIEDSSNASNP